MFPRKAIADCMNNMFCHANFLADCRWLETLGKENFYLTCGIFADLVGSAFFTVPFGHSTSSVGMVPILKFITPLNVAGTIVLLIAVNVVANWFIAWVFNKSIGNKPVNKNIVLFHIAAKYHHFISMLRGIGVKRSTPYKSLQPPRCIHIPVLGSYIPEIRYLVKLSKYMSVFPNFIFHACALHICLCVYNSILHIVSQGIIQKSELT